MVRFILTIAILATLQALKVKEVDFDPSVDTKDLVTAGHKGFSNTKPPKGETLEDLQDEKIKPDHDMYSCLVELDQNIFNFDALSLKDSEYHLNYKGTPPGHSHPANFTVYWNLCGFTNKNRCSDKMNVDSAVSINENMTC